MPGGYRVRPVNNRNIYQVGYRFRVRVRWRGRLYHLGSFGTIAEAKACRNEWMLVHLGPHWREIQASHDRYRTLGRPLGDGSPSDPRLIGKGNRPFSAN
ncbi:hypothetical protein [Tuwongella immobilis]|uniref:Uncharacterized protein n=1 Tax=Tuwongella immobilis TaxID=692036 RepID=A0A6C2YS69_9BACT|nr:hypothetical protein [Tuwongella immobilis]VIP03999.1 unnamed protein product [Tuwongella immobilis]VTS05365.1 unnamed protein product [Tuwongella immobilis]